MSQRYTTPCPEGFQTPSQLDCPNMKETYSDMEGERYRCEKCGRSVYLDYKEMK